MSKKLCEDARLAAECLKETNTFPTAQGILLECADRIEQLERENARLGREVNMAKYGEPNFAWALHSAAMADLQAKLDKAVDALREQSCNCSSNCDWEAGDVCPSWVARTVLAELEKKE